MARALLLPGSAASPDFPCAAHSPPVIGDRSITVVADDSGMLDASPTGWRGRWPTTRLRTRW